MLIITILLFIFCKKYIKNDKTKDLVLKITSVLVVAIHFSSLYVDFFASNGEAMIEDSMLLPIYPCNIIMWLLLIVAFMKNKESNIYKYLSEFTFIGGTFCGLVGVWFNINFLNNPNFFDYSILKGLISHNVMIFGTVWLYLFNYVKIEVRRTTKSIFIGLLIFSIIGLIINVLFAIFDIPGVNAMFMLEPPIKELPIFNFFTIGILGMIISFIGLNVYEYFAFNKEERWITNFKNKRSN
jgi:hypothetical protein